MGRDRRTRYPANEDAVDEALLETFPASDPPFFMAAASGGPRRPRDMANMSDSENPPGSTKAGLSLSLPG